MFSAITLECLNRFWIFKRQFHLIFNRQSVGLRIFLFTCKTKKVAKCKQMIVLSIIWHDVTSAATWPNSSNPENSSNKHLVVMIKVVMVLGYRANFFRAVIQIYPMINIKMYFLLALLNIK